MINRKFIDSLEGTKPVGEVPRDRRGNALDRSGVTIPGVDLGQMSGQEFKGMDLPDALKQKLEPYVGLKQQSAVDFLERNPLILSDADAAILYEAKRKPLEEALARHYNAATGGSHTFADLPDEWQTVIASVANQYGPDLKSRTPNFWNQVVTRDWAAAIENLRNFRDRTPTRRNSEADYVTMPHMRRSFDGY